MTAPPNSQGFLLPLVSPPPKPRGACGPLGPLANRLAVLFPCSSSWFFLYQYLR